MDLVLPADGVPGWLGSLTLRGQGSFDWHFSPEAVATLSPQEARVLRFRVDAVEPPPIIRWGTLSFFVIERFGEYAIRLRDSASEALMTFEGLDHFPVATGWRVAARWHPHDPPKEIPMPNVLDVPSTSTSPGAAVFQVDGEEYSLDLTGDPQEGHLFLVFGDGTNGAESYSGGRFLSVDAPDDNGWVILDFNRAYNPPCVFTPFATCPVPPPGNILPLRTEAGEMMYHGAGHTHLPPH
jgi:uncharacterized protein (DUF1684 family)